MRILYINSMTSRTDSWSGVRSWQFIQELRAAGVEVIIFPVVLDNSPPQKALNSLTQWIKRFVKEQIRPSLALIFIEYFMLIRGIKRTAVDSWKIFQGRHVFKPDIVLARTFEYEWTPWLAARILRRPLVLEVHSPFFIERQLRGRRNSKLLRWFERIQWKHAEHLWVVSPELKTIISENGVLPDRITVIPFGCRLDDLANRQPRLPDGPIQIIHASSFYPWHGIELLLKAFSMAQARVPNLRLCLVGDGIFHSVSQKESRVLGIENLVHFTGWLPRERMIELLNKSDIGVAPYLKLEPFYFAPVKILDYMAAGLAIVASEQGYICEMLENGKNGLLVPPGDVLVLANALVQLAENSDLRQRLGKAAREEVARRHTWERTIQGVLSLSQEAIKSWRMTCK